MTSRLERAKQPTPYQLGHTTFLTYIFSLWAQVISRSV